MAVVDTWIVSTDAYWRNNGTTTAFELSDGFRLNGDSLLRPSCRTANQLACYTWRYLSIVEQLLRPEELVVTPIVNHCSSEVCGHNRIIKTRGWTAIALRIRCPTEQDIHYEIV